jgi:hypothetical protein
MWSVIVKIEVVFKGMSRVAGVGPVLCRFFVETGWWQQPFCFSAETFVMRFFVSFEPRFPGCGSSSLLDALFVQSVRFAPDAMSGAYNGIDATRILGVDANRTIRPRNLQRLLFWKLLNPRTEVDANVRNI